MRRLAPRVSLHADKQWRIIAQISRERERERGRGVWMTGWEYEMSNWRLEERAALLHCFLIHLRRRHPFPIKSPDLSRRGKWPSVSGFVLFCLRVFFMVPDLFADETIVAACVSGLIYQKSSRASDVAICPLSSSWGRRYFTRLVTRDLMFASYSSWRVAGI
jgi:hypothetical protein